VCLSTKEESKFAIHFVPTVQFESFSTRLLPLFCLPSPPCQDLFPSDCINFFFPLEIALLPTTNDVSALLSRHSFSQVSDLAPSFVFLNAVKSPKTLVVGGHFGQPFHCFFFPFHFPILPLAPPPVSQPTLNSGGPERNTVSPQLLLSLLFFLPSQLPCLLFALVRLHFPAFRSLSLCLGLFPSFLAWNSVSALFKLAPLPSPQLRVQPCWPIFSMAFFCL